MRPNTNSGRSSRAPRKRVTGPWPSSRAGSDRPPRPDPPPPGRSVHLGFDKVARDPNVLADLPEPWLDRFVEAAPNHAVRGFDVPDRREGRPTRPETESSTDLTSNVIPSSACTCFAFLPRRAPASPTRTGNHTRRSRMTRILSPCAWSTESPYFAGARRRHAAL